MDTLLLMIKYRRAAIVVASMVLAGGLILTGVMARALWAYPAAPQPMTHAEALVAAASGQDPWIEVVDAHWRCDLPVVMRRDGDSLVTATSGDPPVTLVGKFDRPVDCLRLSPTRPTGTVGRFQGRFAARSREDGLLVPDGGDVLAICTFCGPPNARAGLYVGIGFTVAGAFLLAMMLVPARMLGLRTPSFEPEAGPKRWDKDTRHSGLFIVALGAGVAWFGAGYEMAGVPLPWVCLAAVGFGAVQVLFPGLPYFRRLAADRESKLRDALRGREGPKDP